MVAVTGPRIELHEVGRRFGDFSAVRGLTLSLQPGRIHALIGENGAGKSTALKLIAGLLPPTEGSVSVDGVTLSDASPRAAMLRGIGMVHQHFMLVEPFTALENVMLGAELVRPSALHRTPLLGWFASHGALDVEAARRRAQSLAAEAGLEVSLDTRVEHLSVGEKQRLEILRVLYRGAKAILLDEPTAVLSPVEVGELYATLRRLADQGHTVAVVTHRLDEVARFADEVTAMRRGERVYTEVVDEAARRAPAALIERLTRAVMGGELHDVAPKHAVTAEAPVVLALDGLRTRGTGANRLDGLSISVREREIVGVAGIEGNGQRELATAVAGLTVPSAGTIALHGDSPYGTSLVTSERVQQARARGCVVVLDDRHHDELLLEATVGDNLVVGDLGTFDESLARDRRLARFSIEPRDPSRFGRQLSGGNQQKVVMARALDRPLRALMLAQPTRGVDVGTARIIHEAITEIAGGGAAVLVVSADLNELRTLCHRIVVLREGKVVAEFLPTASDETIGRAMLGSLDASPSGVARDGAEVA